MRTRTLTERLDGLEPTRGEIAERLGVTRISLYRWETGRQPAPRWLELALRWLAHEQTRKKQRTGRVGDPG
jgi:DNA-binding XRE family transcriptional regulator